MLEQTKKNNILKVIYKLTNDLLFLILLLFGFILLTDGILPGLATRYVAYLDLTLILSLILGIIFWIGGKIKKNNPIEIKNSQKLFFILTFVSMVLIFLSLFKFSLITALIIFILSIIMGYLIYKLFYSDIV